MSDLIHNPFLNSLVLIPNSQGDFYNSSCQTGKQAINRGKDFSPFPRMIDLWFLAFCMSIRDTIEPVALVDNDLRRIYQGVGLTPGQVHIIMLSIINIDGNLSIVTQPGEMMKIANGLAAAGINAVEHMLKGSNNPIWNLSENLEKCLAV